MGANELAKHYEGLRQAQLDQLMAKFEEIDGGGGKKPQPKAQKKVTVQTNIGKKGVSAPKNNAPPISNQFGDEAELPGAD